MFIYFFQVFKFSKILIFQVYPQNLLKLIDICCIISPFIFNFINLGLPFSQVDLTKCCCMYEIVEGVFSSVVRSVQCDRRFHQGQQYSVSSVRACCQAWDGNYKLGCVHSTGIRSRYPWISLSCFSGPRAHPQVEGCVGCGGGVCFPASPARMHTD